ncbi:CgeB family protein [Lysobacter arvi]|uniref:Glycosyltransferase n=1 Tax=Lysobacter arvi TaxID=3038776 RepID=A0ABU1CBT8_9GAMM|nr:glycosyltransferase [Lysobacter arvi]MDR0182621.1 glycosyltransferase [Lysobacter arvi]
MKFVLFYHSLISDWNHGNAHFLRGIVAELQSRGHDVQVYEPEDAWSVAQLIDDGGEEAIAQWQARYPQLRSHRYRREELDYARVLDGADVALVHEWNEPALVAAVGRQAPASCRVLFHDTHHRSVSAPEEMARYDLRDYDGVLAFGEAVRQRYLERGWCERAYTWHEAADTRVFRPRPKPAERDGDLVWIGNWGDDERAAELREFLIEPVRSLGLRARLHGVRYPDDALALLRDAGIDYRGWLPNWRAPEVFARFTATVHVPRRPYVRLLPGIPTIRVFEALACGIALVSAPWDDAEHLFAPGHDFLVARDGAQTREHLRLLVNDAAAAESLAAHGLATVLARHTCAHRVDELLSIVASLGPAENAHSPPHFRSLSHA